MTVPMRSSPVAGDIMESVLLKGDLAKLTPDERVRYYGEVCRSLGLNPLTKPFEFITLNGKLQLYALRTCADQLRKINGVSLEIVSREVANEILTIHVRARLPDGRSDEDLGAVAFPDTLKGEARANAELKAVTKAKRRATMSICGLGWLDETEIADIPASAKRPAPPAPNVMLPAHDPETGEVKDGESPGGEPPAPAAQEARAGAGTMSVKDYCAHWRVIKDEARSAEQLGKAWNKDKPTRQKILNADADAAEALKELQTEIVAAVQFLKEPVT